jgi:hypothetical protein
MIKVGRYSMKEGDLIHNKLYPNIKFKLVRIIDEHKIEVKKVNPSGWNHHDNASRIEDNSNGNWEDLL